MSEAETPAAFFEQTLPQVYGEALKNGHPALPSMELEVELEGLDSWSLGFTPQGVTVTRGIAEDPLAILHGDAGDWELFARDLLPALLARLRGAAPDRRLDRSGLDAAVGIAMQALRARELHLQLVVTAAAGKDRRVSLFAGGADAETRAVRFVLSGEVMQALGRGALTPTDALAQGKIRIDGDFASLMALTSKVMGRYQSKR